MSFRPSTAVVTVIAALSFALPAGAKSKATTTTPATTTPAATTPATTTPATTAPAATTPAPMSKPVFPTAVDAKYKSLSSGKGMMKTCDDQYKANKATGGNAGLKWIQKGGGYYSECLKSLKGK